MLGKGEGEERGARGKTRNWNEKPETTTKGEKKKYTKATALKMKEVSWTQVKEGEGK